MYTSLCKYKVDFKLLSSTSGGLIAAKQYLTGNHGMARRVGMKKYMAAPGILLEERNLKLVQKYYLLKRITLKSYCKVFLVVIETIYNFFKFKLWSAISTATKY